MPIYGAKRVKYHNRTKVLLCYLLTWGLALLLPFLALKFIYPVKLAATAPELAASVSALPFALPAAAGEAVAATAFTQGMDQSALQAAITARDLLWRYTVGGVTAVAWALSLLWQLLWRAVYLRPKQGARAAMRAVTTYRWSLSGIVLLNLLGALFVFWLGVRNVAGRTLWDYLVYFGGFALAPLAAMACFRLGAPPAISGKNAFFRRL